MCRIVIRNNKIIQYNYNTISFVFGISVVTQPVCCVTSEVTAAKDTTAKHNSSLVDSRRVINHRGTYINMYTGVLKGLKINKIPLQSYFGWVGEVGELAAIVFRTLSTEPVLDKEAFSVEGVLVMKPFSIELPRVRDARVGGFETLEERAWGLTT